MCEQNDESIPLVVSSSKVFFTSSSVLLVPSVRHISAVGCFPALRQIRCAIIAYIGNNP
jgi:hypothetical protein